MGNRKSSDKSSFLIILFLILAIGLVALGYLIYSGNESASPISPISPQAIDEELQSLEGGIKWFDGFFTWNPKTQAELPYAFITGTVFIHWYDAETGLIPIAHPVIRDQTNLIIELELRGTETYTRKIDTGIQGVMEPRTGVFSDFVWIWDNVAPGEYDEYIKAHWQAGDDKIPLQLVRDGQVVGPVTNFALYREGLIVPELTWLPVIMKSD